MPTGYIAAEELASELASRAQGDLVLYTSQHNASQRTIDTTVFAQEIVLAFQELAQHRQHRDLNRAEEGGFIHLYRPDTTKEVIHILQGSSVSRVIHDQDLRARLNIERVDEDRTVVPIDMLVSVAPVYGDNSQIIGAKTYAGVFVPASFFYYQGAIPPQESPEVGAVVDGVLAAHFSAESIGRIKPTSLRNQWVYVAAPDLDFTHLDETQIRHTVRRLINCHNGIYVHVKNKLEDAFRQLASIKL